MTVQHDIRRLGSDMFRKVVHRMNEMELDQISTRKLLADVNGRVIHQDEQLMALKADLAAFEALLKEAGLI
jgi:hypothetical protein